MVFERAEELPVPTVFHAETLKLKGFRGASPVMVTLVAVGAIDAEPTWRPRPSNTQTVWPRRALPPSKGMAQATVADFEPPVALTPAGASGTVATGSTGGSGSSGSGVTGVTGPVKSSRFAVP